jgi:hypothetical protein
MTGTHHFVRLGRRIINLALVTELYWGGIRCPQGGEPSERLVVVFCVRGVDDGPEVTYFSGDEALALWRVMGVLSDDLMGAPSKSPEGGNS